MTTVLLVAGAMVLGSAATLGLLVWIGRRQQRSTRLPTMEEWRERVGEEGLDSDEKSQVEESVCAVLRGPDGEKRTITGRT